MMASFPLRFSQRLQQQARAPASAALALAAFFKDFEPESPSTQKKTVEHKHTNERTGHQAKISQSLGREKFEDANLSERKTLTMVSSEKREIQSFESDRLLCSRHAASFEQVPDPILESKLEVRPSKSCCVYQRQRSRLIPCTAKKRIEEKRERYWIELLPSRRGQPAGPSGA